MFSVSAGNVRRRRRESSKGWNCESHGRGIFVVSTLHNVELTLSRLLGVHGRGQVRFVCESLSAEGNLGGSVAKTTAVETHQRLSKIRGQTVP